MTSDVRAVTPDTQVVDVLDLFREMRISGTPVVENGQMVGLISLEDLIRAVQRGNGHAPASEYMTTNVITIHDYEPVVEALEVFSRTRVGRLPVIDENGQLVGILTKGNITRGTLYDRTGRPLAYDQGIGAERSRVYSDPSLAPVTGYVTGLRLGIAGVERSHNAFLLGQPGGLPDPKKPTCPARGSWGQGLRKQ